MSIGGMAARRWTGDPDEEHEPPADRGGDPAGSVPLTVYLQLRPTRAAAGQCLAALNTLISAHRAVPVGLCGVSRDERHLRLTLGVDLGARDQVARFSPAAVGAYGFVEQVFTVLFDYLPQYVVEPSEEERAAAQALTSRSLPHPRSAAEDHPAPAVALRVAG